MYKELAALEKQAQFVTVNVKTRNTATMAIWKEHNNFLVPWVNYKDLVVYKGTFPEDCVYGGRGKGNDDDDDASSTDDGSNVVTADPTPAPFH